MKQRATALTNSQLLDQLCDLLIPKLEERLATRLASKQHTEDTVVKSPYISFLAGNVLAAGAASGNSAQKIQANGRQIATR